MLSLSSRAGLPRVLARGVTVSAARFASAQPSSTSGVTDPNKLAELTKHETIPDAIKSESRPPRPYANEFLKHFPKLETPDGKHPVSSLLVDMRKKLRRDYEQMVRREREEKEQAEGEEEDETADAHEQARRARRRKQKALKFGFTESVEGDVQHLASAEFARGDGASDIEQLFVEGAPGWLQQEQARRGFLGLLHRPELTRIVAHLQKLDQSFFSSPECATGAKDCGHTTVLGGELGYGKSATLAQVLLWARTADWLTVHIPSGYDWVSDGIIYPSRCMPGLWDQPEVALRFCANMLAVHGDKLHSIPLKTAFEIEGFERDSETTLGDLMEFGKQSFRFACASIYQFRQELSLVTEYPVLLAIDGVNAFDYTSGFGDPNAERFTGELMPARMMSLTEMFYDYRDPGLVRGTVVAALSKQMDTNKFFEENGGRDNVLEIPPFTPDQVGAIVRYLREQQWIHQDIEPAVSYVHALTGGIPGEVTKYVDAL